MTGDFELHLDEQAIEDLGFSDEAVELAQFTGDEVAEVAAHLAPKLTGEGAASIHAEVAEDEESVYADVSWAPDQFHMYFQETGTEKMAPNPFLVPAMEQTSI